MQLRAPPRYQGIVIFFRRTPGHPRRLGVLPGAFNPPTCAHLALARAALDRVDEVLFTLPREFPHKRYEGAGFEQRLGMLAAALESEPQFSIGVSDGGLFLEIARECRAAYGPETELYFVCGRDAAERVVNWDYRREGALEEQLREYQLLVAPRRGLWRPPEHLRHRIHELALAPDYEEVSASEVRERIRCGEAWEHMVPLPIRQMVAEIYGLRPAP